MGIDRIAKIVKRYSGQAPALSESQEGRDLAQWLRSRPGLLFCHIPNEGNRSMVHAFQLRAEGLAKGAPDYLVFTQTAFVPVGAALELKRVGGRKPTDHQQQWLRDLEDLGWRTTVAYGAVAAQEWLVSLGY